MIQAATLQRIMHFARAIGGDDDDRRLLRLDRAEFRDGNLEIGKDLEKEGLESLIGAVDLVDEEDRCSSGFGASSACSSGRFTRNRSEKTSLPNRSRSSWPEASATRISIIWAE